MRQARRIKKEFWVVVEGETEKLYIEHVVKLINTANASDKPILVVKPEVCDVVKFSKRHNMPVFYYVKDVEGSGETDLNNFKLEIDKSKKIFKESNKKCHLFYSNMCFELWVILHFYDSNSHYSDKRRYEEPLNKILNSNYNYSEFKKESIFQEVLNKITLKHVFDAIKRAEKMQTRNKENKATIKHKEFVFFKHNPATTMHEFVKMLLKSVGIKG